jgi:hypothetical protein
MTDSTSQAQAIIKQAKINQNVQTVNYPDDLGDYYMSLDFYDYRAAFGPSSSATSSTSNLSALQKLYNADKTSVNNAINKPTSFARIKLPIPANLKDSFKVSYENTAFGGTIGAINDITTAGEHFSENMLGDQLKEAGTAAGKATLNYISKNALFGLDVGGVLDQITGNAVNPNLAVLFRGPTLKTHNFEWNFAARTASESANIRKIRSIINRAMSPSRLSAGTSALLRYPSECLIQFVGTVNNNSFLYPLRPVIIEDASYDYAPLGQVSFFQKTEQVTSITLTLACQETSYYTRDSFDDGTQYGSDGFQTADLTKGGFNAFGVKP